MNYLTIEDKIEHCKTSIKVCEETIEVEGPNGNEFWIKFKKQWEIQLKELEEELKYSKQ
jgi:hypothetical protein